MEMHQIRYFLAVSEKLNFTRAAEQCNVTQPALTRAIQQLEQEFGGELLRRERSLTHLTDLGERMLPLMRKCYESAIAAKSLAHSLKEGTTAPLSLAVSQSLNLEILIPPLHEIARRFPGLQLKIRRGSGPEINEFLKSGEVELGIADITSGVWDRLDCYPLFDESFEMFISGDHRFACKDFIECDDLMSEQFLFHEKCETAEAITRFLYAKGIAGDCAHQVANISDMQTLLEAGLGTAILPVSGVQSEKLRHLPLAGLDLKRTVAVYAVAGRRRTEVSASLLNLLRAAQWPTGGDSGVSIS